MLMGATTTEQEYIVSSLRASSKVLEGIVDMIERNEDMPDQSISPIVRNIEDRLRSVRRKLEKGGR